MKAIYRGLCPNCGGDISDEELLGRLVCRSCLPRPVGGLEELYEELRGRGRLRDYREVMELERDLASFIDFFKSLVAAKPWPLQEIWARRVLLGCSFALVAPTGMGKTVFGLVMSLYLTTMRGWKCYVIVPSSLLVQHLLEKSYVFLEKLGLDRSTVVGYYSGMPSRESEDSLKRVSSGEFKILITTDRFIYNRFDLLSRNTFNFVFVDDVDSFLKSPKNIDKVVALLGYGPEVIEKVLRAIDLRHKRRRERGDEEELADIERTIPEYRERAGRRILVVSGATLRGRRSKRMQIFRYLFGFEPGFNPDLVRNIANLQMGLKDSVEGAVVELVKRHGKGCLVFVPQTKGADYAVKIAKALQREGISAYAYQKMNPHMLHRFVSGDYQVLVGVASNRSPLARGIDLPETIRYVIFAGVPRREIRISKDEYNPQKLLTLFRSIANVFEERFARDASRVMSMLSKAIPVRGEVIERVREALLRGEGLEGFDGYVLNAVREARQLLAEALTEEGVKRLSERLDIYVRVEDEGYSLIVPDIEGFIQASGRTSRLYAGGISRGISIMLVDDEKAFHGLLKRLQVVYEDERFEEYGEEVALAEFRRVDEDRERIARIRRGEELPEEVEVLRSALVVVESPTKAHTIASFFGRPARRRVGELTVYESTSGEVVINVVACQGHIFDLTTVDGYHGVLIEGDNFVPIYTYIQRCKKCGNQFTDHESCPNCGSNEVYSKRAIIDALRRLALESNEVLIATDPDSEGEKIGYDVYCALYPYNRKVERLEFHEVTRKALTQALSSPLMVRTSLVEAQTVRRIEDRWIGFELSRRLWERFGRRTLSAGRVQTPVLGWIIERMGEAKKRRLVVSVTLEGGLSLELVDPSSYESLIERFKSGQLTGEVKVEAYEEVEIHPPPPYTTDSMLKDAANQLRFNVGYTMRLAQTLFESGLITYHRTDVTTVSTTGMGVARQYIDENHPGLFKPRPYREEGAHECIRPTKPLSRRQLEFYLSSNVIRLPTRLSKDELSLYEMIFKRFIASQMASAKVVVQRCVIKVDGEEAKVSRVVRVLEPGFLLVNPTLRVLNEVEPGIYKVIDFSSKKVPAAWLYTEGDLIALMKERGIGRPSTYSKIVDLLFERGYAFQSGGRVLSTKLGQVVYDYLSRSYGPLVSEELTRRLEATMDAIERGELNHQDVLRELHQYVALIAQRAE